jgi:hypothetical protein
LSRIGFDAEDIAIENLDDYRESTASSSVYKLNNLLDVTTELDKLSFPAIFSGARLHLSTEEE